MKSKATKTKESFLRSKDVAQVLDMCPDDVIILVKKGKLKAVKQGRYWKYSLSEVLKFKEQNS